MTNAYKTTSVPVSRSQEQIRKLLRDFGARGSQFSEDYDNGIIAIRFAKEMGGFVRTVSVSMKVPEQPQQKRRRTVRYSRGRMVYGKLPEERQEQMVKATYRAFHDWLKAQFVSIDFGIRTFESAFLNDFEITDRNGVVTTLGKAIMPHLIETRPEFLLEEVVEGVTS